MSLNFFIDRLFDASLLRDPDDAVIVTGFSATLPDDWRPVCGPLPGGSVVYTRHPLRRGYLVFSIAPKYGPAIIQSGQGEEVEYPDN